VAILPSPPPLVTRRVAGVAIVAVKLGRD
jgi:hypothetical protein